MIVYYHFNRQLLYLNNFNEINRPMIESALQTISFLIKYLIVWLMSTFGGHDLLAICY